MGYAPPALYALRDGWKAIVPTAVFSGIAPPRWDAYGFHNCPNNLINSGQSNDYSLRDLGNRLIDGVDREMFDAIDMSMSKADMILITGRVYRSWTDQNDPRLNGMYEVIGTLDGINVIYMNCQTGQRGTADDTHLWHMHAAPLRINGNNMEVINAFLSVIRGETVEQWLAGGVDMPLISQDFVGIWTHDLVDGPSIEMAYKVLLRSADSAQAARQNTVALVSKVDGLTTALNTALELLRTGGGDADTAAILAKIDQRAEEEVARDAAAVQREQQLVARIEQLQAELDRQEKEREDALRSALTTMEEG